jgi:hypothetical protein
LALLYNLARDQNPSENYRSDPIRGYIFNIFILLGIM